MCVYYVYINTVHTHLLYKQKLLFWMRLITINRLTALVYTPFWFISPMISWAMLSSYQLLGQFFLFHTLYKEHNLHLRGMQELFPRNIRILKYRHSLRTRLAQRWPAESKRTEYKKHYEKVNERKSERLYNDLGFIQSPAVRWTFASLRRTLWLTVPYRNRQVDDLCYCSNVGNIMLPYLSMTSLEHLSWKRMIIHSGMLRNTALSLVSTTWQNTMYHCAIAYTFF